MSPLPYFLHLLSLNTTSFHPLPPPTTTHTTPLQACDMRVKYRDPMEGYLGAILRAQTPLVPTRWHNQVA